MGNLLRSGGTFSIFLQLYSFIGILSVISSVPPLVCCLVTRLVSGFLNFHFMYLIRLVRLRYYSLLCILRICVAAGTLPTSSMSLFILVWYSMLRASSWFFATFLPKYADPIPVVIYVSLTICVTCEN